MVGVVIDSEVSLIEKGFAETCDEQRGSAGGLTGQWAI